MMKKSMATGCAMNSVFTVPTPRWQQKRKAKLMKAKADVKDRLAADKALYKERVTQPWPVVKPPR
jgi:hypothetical protein